MPPKRVKTGLSPAVMAKFDKFHADFEKDFGLGTLRRGKPKKYEVISTGSVELDIQLGVGGYIEGRLYEWWGPGDMGKSSFAFLACAEAQKKYPNKMVAYIDAENKVDEVWAEQLGVNLSRWWLYTPRTAEEVSDAVKRFLDMPEIALVVVDSVGALISRAETEKDADEVVVGNVPKIVTRMVKMATLGAARNGAVVLIINQPRSNISAYGSPTTTPGGWALKMGTTARLQIRASDKRAIEAEVRGEKIPIGREVAIKVERNKVAPAGQTVRPFFKNVETKRYGPVGIDRTAETLGMALKFEIIGQAGAYYDIPTTGERIKSREAVLEYLRDNPTEVDKLRDMCIQYQADVVFEEEKEPEDEPEEDLYDDPVSEIEEEPEKEPEGSEESPVILAVDPMPSESAPVLFMTVEP